MTTALTDQKWLHEYLTPPEAAAEFRVTVEWLQRGRTEGWGPKFRRLSPKQIVYMRLDLVAFADGKEFSSTSQYPGKPGAQDPTAAPGVGSGSTGGGEDV
jgi:hypothetical protein